MSEPAIQASSVPRYPKPESEGRWRWWYSAIADWMIRNPSGNYRDCARDLNKSKETIGMIARTDLFKRYLYERKREWREQHDQILANKLTRVASLGLDILAEQLETKKTAVPIRDVSQIANSALERLGYGVAPPSTAVQVNVQIPSVSPAALAEARDALRLAEERRRSPTASLYDTSHVLDLPSNPAEGRGANDQWSVGEVGEADGAPDDRRFATRTEGGGAPIPGVAQDAMEEDDVPLPPLDS